VDVFEGSAIARLEVTKTGDFYLGNWCFALCALIGAILSFSAEIIGLGVFLLVACLLVPAIIYLIFLQPYTVQKIENGYIWIKFRRPDIASAIYAAYYKQ
jgi:hypothetical protein